MKFTAIVLLIIAAPIFGFGMVLGAAVPCLFVSGVLALIALGLWVGTNNVERAEAEQATDHELSAAAQQR